MKKFVTVGLIAISTCLLLTGCHIKHEWREATCTEPKTCLVGGETKGEALGHTWVEATCTEPKTCSVCGETEGEALGHTWVEATCTEPKTCSVCGETEGEALGHTWVEATCTEPKTCSVCGETEGEALGHNWQEANCMSPKTCLACGVEEGEIGDHIWMEATCQMPKTCSICGETDGEAIPHNYDENGICTMCGEAREVELTIDNVNDFLDLSWEKEEYSDGSFLTIQVSITPKTDEYIFQDVYVKIRLYVQSSYRENYYQSNYPPQGISIDSDGYGTFRFSGVNNRSINDGGYHNKFNDDIIFGQVTGTCIRR